MFKSRNGNDRETRENKLPRKKWEIQSRELILTKFCFRENLYTRIFLPKVVNRDWSSTSHPGAFFLKIDQ